METIQNFPEITKKDFPLLNKNVKNSEYNLGSLHLNSVTQDLKLVLNNLQETLKQISKVCK